MQHFLQLCTPDASLGGGTGKSVILCSIHDDSKHGDGKASWQIIMVRPRRSTLTQMWAGCCKRSNAISGRTWKMCSQFSMVCSVCIITCSLLGSSLVCPEIMIVCGGFDGLRATLIHPIHLPELLDVCKVRSLFHIFSMVFLRRSFCRAGIVFCPYYIVSVVSFSNLG